MGAFKVAVKGATEMLLTGEIAAVANPDRERLGAQLLTDVNALQVVRHRLGACGRVGVRQAAELVTVRLPTLIGKGVGVDGIELQIRIGCGFPQFRPIAAAIPRNVQGHTGGGCGQLVDDAAVLHFVEHMLGLAWPWKTCEACAAGAHARHEGIELPLRVVPDLLRGGLAVDLGVGRVVELLGHDRARDLLQEFLGLGDRALHALRAGGEGELGPEIGQHLAPLERHRLGHHQDQPVAAGGGHEGQRDAGVAGGRLDQGAAGLQHARGLHGVDHVDADAVLHRGDRVEELELQQDLRLDAALLGEALSFLCL